MINFQATIEASEPLTTPCGSPRDLPRPVGIRHFCVTQPGRLDMDGRTRRFMGSVLYPAADNDAPAGRIVDVLSPYGQPALDFLLRDATPAELVHLREQLPRLTVHARRDAPAAVDAGSFPVLLFNPGGETSRAACFPFGRGAGRGRLRRAGA